MPKRRIMTRTAVNLTRRKRAIKATSLPVKSTQTSLLSYISPLTQRPNLHINTHNAPSIPPPQKGKAHITNLQKQPQSTKQQTTSKHYLTQKKNSLQLASNITSPSQSSTLIEHIPPPPFHNITENITENPYVPSELEHMPNGTGSLLDQGILQPNEHRTDHMESDGSPQLDGSRHGSTTSTPDKRSTSQPSSSSDSEGSSTTEDPCNAENLIDQTEPTVPHHSEDGHYGTSIFTKNKKCIQLYFQNVKLSASITMAAWNNLGAAIQDLQADLFGISESCLNWDSPELLVQSKMQLRKHLRHHIINTSRAQEPTPTLYQPGGTCTVIMDNLTERIASKTTDHMGRWNSVTLCGASDAKITIVTVYQSNEHPGSMKGPFTFHNQQVRLLELTQDDCSPRDAFLHDLTLYLTSLSQMKHEIILAGYFNEDLTSSTTRFTALFANLGLVDIFSRLHPDDHLTTYIRGSKQLDYILMTKKLVPHVTSTGYLPYNLIVFSHHWGQFFDIQTASLFGSTRVPLAPPAQRKLDPKNDKDKNSYTMQVQDYIQKQNMTTQCRQLQSNFDADKLRALDRDLTRGMLLAEGKIKRPQSLGWTPKLAALKREFHIFKLCYIERKLNKSFQVAINYLQNKLDEAIAIPNNEEELLKRLAQSRKALRDYTVNAPSHRIAFLDSIQQEFAQNGDTH